MWSSTKAMAAATGIRLFCVISMLFLAGVDAVAGQASATSSARSTHSNNAVATPAAQKPTSSPTTPDADGDFRKRAEARWNAARKGEIEVYLVPDRTKHDVFTVRVVVTRAPAGSDGMTAVSSDGATWNDLLKLDDEVLVRLSPEAVGAFEIEPHEASPEALIHHLNPGGHAEWTWTVRRISPGENHLLLQADVVYRRKFSPGGKPVVTYQSAKLPLPFAEPPGPAK